MRETVELIFNTSLDDTHTMRVPGPRPTLSAMHVIAAADNFIVANPFNADVVGALTSLRRADRVQVSRRILLPE